MCGTYQSAAARPRSGALRDRRAGSDDRGRRDRQNLRQRRGRAAAREGASPPRSARGSALGIDHRLGAEILDEQQARVQVLAVDSGALKPSARRPDRGRRRHEPLGELRDGAVGLAATNRRPVGARRRDHQDRGLAVRLHEPLIGAGRGIALHRHAHRIRPAAALHKARNAFSRWSRGRSAGAVSMATRPAPPPGARSSAMSRRSGLQGRRRPARAIPRARSRCRHLVPARARSSSWRRRAVEIGMHDGAERRRRRPASG